MKCPVCDKQNTSMLCPRCGFDSSRNFERHPTLGASVRGMSVSALRQEWQSRQVSEEPASMEKPVAPEVISPEKTAPREKKKSKSPHFILVAAVAILLVGIGAWLAAEYAGSASQWSSNLLRGDDAASVFVYDTDIRKDHVRAVTFLDSLSAAPQTAVDVSVDGNGSVMMWAVPNGAQYYELFFAANGGINGKDACRNLFHSYVALKTVHFNGNFHTEEAEDMSSMFYYCRSLMELDLSTIDTSSVRDMFRMFCRCTALTSLDLSGFDTSHVTNMSSMFSWCAALRELDLSGFDTSGLQYMSNMFYECPAGSKWQHLLQ